MNRSWITAGRVGLALAVAAALPSCGEEELTEIVVAVDTDLQVPDELDAIRIDVIGPQGELRRASGTVRNASELPETLGVVHEGGPLGPVRITVTGRLEGSDVIQRRAVVDFVPDEVVVLRLWLERSCLGVPCPEDETCAEGECRTQRVEESELERWEGSVQRADGGRPTVGDGGTDGGDDCTPEPEACNELDDDCDGDADEDFDLMGDPAHCGACDAACPEDPLHAAAVCAEGVCGLACDPGWADCSTETEGCESSLSSATTCGDCETTCDSTAPFCGSSGGGGFECVSACGPGQTACGESCVDTDSSPLHCGGCGTDCPSPPHATAACAGGECGYLCDDGYRDCDGRPGNGCESRLRDADNCGGCGVTCEPDDALATCSTGTCTIVDCVGYTDDCNGRVDDGCEVSLGTDEDHCGACGTACPADAPSATVQCIGGRCTAVCDPGFADCNGRVEDGCEVSLSSTATCGSCGIRCDGSTPVCAGSVGSGFRCVADCGTGTLCAGSCVSTSTDPLHCGGCGEACPEPARSTRYCEGSECGFTCDEGWADCDGTAGNGCEAHIDVDPTRCGNCGTSCASGVCTDGSCEPLTLIDAGTDAGMDGGTDAGMDAGTDAGMDGAVEGGMDGMVEGGTDAATDGGPDAATDGGPDAATDGGPDAATDGGPDASTDGGPDGG